MADYFISYTSSDKNWAEWIGHVLEDAEYSVILQEWDFQPGSNFVLEMQRATESAHKTIIVLSPDYLKSQYAAPEWAAAFANDPEGKLRKIIPVMVRECAASGMLKSLVHINLVGLTDQEAGRRLIDGLHARRRKPSDRPPFPGALSQAETPVQVPHVESGRAKRYIPKVKRAASDLEKRDFVEAAFETIKNFFKHAIVELGSENRHVRGKLAVQGELEFAAELFVDGGSKTACRIWLGDEFRTDSICYAEGSRLPRGNACNEILSVEDHGGELVLSAMMDFGFNVRGTPKLDTKRMSVEQAAEYLWRRFVSPLEM